MTGLEGVDPWQDYEQVKLIALIAVGIYWLFAQGFE